MSNEIFTLFLLIKIPQLNSSLKDPLNLEMMEFSLAQEEIPQEQHPKEKKGGLKTIPFIMAMEVFEKTASMGLMLNMIVYLTKEYHMASATAASTLFICSSAMNFMPAFGALLSDSYLGRFSVITFGSLASLIGMVLLWLTAMLPGAKPPACDEALHNCEPPTSAQLVLLFTAFAVMAVGAGGIRPCTIAFGADQLGQENNPDKERALQSFFNWYYTLVSLSILTAMTVIVYIQDNLGWKVGLGVPAMLMALSSLLFLSGSSCYVKVNSNKNVLSGIAQVFVVSFKNRHLSLERRNSDGRYHHPGGSRLTAPTEKLRFLSKACIIRDPEKDLKPDRSAANPWNLCTVEQVEDVKSVLRLIPIWTAATMADLMNSQGSFMVLQARTMDRHVGSKFEIPAGSFGVFSITTLIVWVTLYDRFIIPQLAKITRRPRGLKLRHRMMIGLLLFCMSMALAAIVEAVRRRAAIQQGLQDDEAAVLRMSAMWLVPQYCLTGLAEAFCIITQIEFYYSELPKCMASLGMALFEVGMGVGNLVGSLLVRLVDDFTGSNGRVSWVSNNLNKGHYDYYYWLLALAGVINFLYFLICSWAYGEEGRNTVWEEERCINGEEERQNRSR